MAGPADNLPNLAADLAQRQSLINSSNSGGANGDAAGKLVAALGAAVGINLKNIDSGKCASLQTGALKAFTPLPGLNLGGRQGGAGDKMMQAVQRAFDEMKDCGKGVTFGGGAEMYNGTLPGVSNSGVGGGSGFSGPSNFELG